MASRSCDSASVKVSALVSVYRAERFLRGCLDDLIRQTMFDRMEVIVVDACSPENEEGIVREFQREHPNILFVRTRERESLYASWNRAIGIARGEYLTNANADDRHHPAFCEKLAAALDAHPQVGLVYADQRVTNTENALFETAPVVDRMRWREYDHLNLLRRCEVGPQPMWRASLHRELGLFDPDFTVTGDLEFWLRVSERHAFLHIPEELGLYLRHEGNLEHADRQRTYEEERRVKEAALRRFLAPSFVWREQLDPLLLAHSRLLAHLFQKLQSGGEVDFLTLEYHVFAYALLAAKTGRQSEALHALRGFFSVCHEAKNAVHLYRTLLLTSPGQAPGVRVDVPATREPPLVSIVVPLYNQGHYLEEAVRSALHQTEPRWEMLIVNDGSTDRSLSMAKELVKTLQDPRIRIVSQTNAGKGKTRNRGVRETGAPFVCVLDADDMICPAYLAAALSILEREPDIGWVCPQTLVFGGNNHLTWTWEYDFFASLLQCPAPSSALYRRAVWEEVQGYDEDMIDAEDYVFWIKAGERGWRGRTTEDVLFVYRHAFRRFGCEPRINVRRKQQYIARHPWWYKRLSARDMLPYLHRYAVMIFPEELRNAEAMESVRAAYGDREAFRAAVDALKRTCGSDSRV